ncbi:MAG TPA: lysophospholipid acyltransferase family protein, partial [Gemmataceae bacterium]
PLLWFFLGMAYLPLIATFQIALPERVQPEGFALYLGTGAAALALAALFLGYLLGGAGALPGLAIPVVTGLALVVFGWLYLRPMIESLAEVLLWPMYRVSATGPGLERFPMHGPVLVLGNHTSYLDPLFLSKHTPRPIIAIMTSRFYDMKLLRPLMKYVFRAIRVPERPVRREAPELKEAVAALDRGECFVIFPEGYLQRKDEPVLRRFARGVWEILAARPNTPVIACWLEGGWGTYFSYKNGPPMTNKPMDWWVRIRVAYGEGERIPPEVLADHIRTRRYLMERCLQARELLGLPPAEVPLPRVGEPAEREPEPVPPDPPDPAGPVEQPPSR